MESPEALASLAREIAAFHRLAAGVDDGEMQTYYRDLGQQLQLALLDVAHVERPKPQSDERHTFES